MKDCCNNNCNQGRDCPAQVAPIGCSYSKYENDYYTMWADDMRVIAKVFLSLLLVFLFSVIGVIAFIVN